MVVHTPVVLSIQSHVVYGHVGNRSAVFPLELLGIETWPLNTVQFSSHSGKPGWKGSFFPSQHITDVIDALKVLAVLKNCDAIISGYIGNVAMGEAIIGAVKQIVQANSAALYCCDPVMGDFPEGYYVAPGLFDFFKQSALPLATIVTPNQFEAELFYGQSIQNDADTAKAADSIHALGPAIVIITSCRSGRSDSIKVMLSCKAGKYYVETPLLAFDSAPKGSGDLFTALFLGHYLLTHDPVLALENSTNTIWSILELTHERGLTELAILQSAAAILLPPKRFTAHRYTF
ncbi:MAG: pyridoxal kinase [Spirochaetes bacterium GWD1_61_31]|nr:MAG: pyridoxal kinase [Spirochaetes bacterium GWB1_60_80]OHD29594.1 MAG: pyridoxal kinase [Spirochaetes bacterium GWC1_61_12]OHD37499.1 MAG: pyridoxal kinase [Spirochaetes bacterium GWD1_61_31]OHD41992.1 MAG: pyridoxal kinase [Spirochaetes bacterium GWE1_60_18]OHD61741.1 MAG: pyridoxal kinase [Spirochaetes bacterium GWF1_60_12]